MNSQLSHILKKAKLEEGKGSFQECGRAAVLARTLQIFAPKSGQVFLNTFDGLQIIRLGYVLRKYDLQHTVCTRLSGGPGYQMDFEKLHKALK